MRLIRWKNDGLCLINGQSINLGTYEYSFVEKYSYCSYDDRILITLCQPCRTKEVYIMFGNVMKHIHGSMYSMEILDYTGLSERVLVISQRHYIDIITPTYEYAIFEDGTKRLYIMNGNHLIAIITIDDTYVYLYNAVQKRVVSYLESLYTAYKAICEYKLYNSDDGYFYINLTNDLI